MDELPIGVTEEERAWVNAQLDPTRWADALAPEH